jgi:TonB-linked SusC/RagA family outer membrane protein
MKQFTLILSMVLLTLSTVLAQKAITGTVIDDAGEPLIGASVVVKGTENGTVTEFDGTYSLSANEGDVVLVSYTGYTDMEQTVGASNTLDFTLSEGILLTNVVVTALNISRDEKSIGYAVQTVDGDAITQARESNLVNALSGRVAGAQITNSSGAVGSSSRIVLRGATSIGGGNQALFVVDGVPVSNGTAGSASSAGSAGSGGGFNVPNGIADINPDDIETITILKGPNAAALYGAQASGGVIVITTKSGSNRKGVGVSFNSSTTFENPLVIPDFQNSFGQGGNQEYFEFIDGQSGDGGIDESWGPALDRGLEFIQWNSYQNGGAPLPWVSQPNNIKDFYETGVTTNNNVSFSGGNDDATFRLSMGMSNQKGMVPNTDFTRYSVSGNSRANLTKKLSVGLTVNYIKSKSGNLPTGGYNNENPVQQMIWSGRNVDFQALKDYNSLPLSADGTAAAGTPLNWNTVFQNNPYWVLDNNLNKFDKDRVMGNVNLSYELMKGLSVRGTVSLDAYNQTVSEQKAIGSNEFQEGFYAETTRRISRLNNELLLRYENKITEDFDFNVNLGGNMRYINSSLLYGEASQLELPNLYTLTNVKSGVTPILANITSKERVNSVYGFGQIGYKNAVYLDVTLRNDWFSTLPGGNNSFLYPSVTMSTVISELVDINSDILSFLKIRGGWSLVGSNGQLNPYQTTNAFAFSDAFGTVSQANLPNTLNDPNLKPETTRGIEFGVDARLFKDRLSLDVTYYDQLSKDLILGVDVDPSSGYTRNRTNVGDISNKGIELQVGIVPIKTKDFRLGLDFNFAKNINKVKNLGDVNSVSLGGQWNVEVQAVVGEAYGTLFGPAYDRNENGDIIYEDGLPTIGASKILGNVTPDWTGGITLEMSYRGITFNSIFDARIGGDIFTMTNTWGRYAGVLSETVDGRETGLVGVGSMNIGTAESPEWVANDIVVSAESWNKRAYSNSVSEGSVFDASFVKWRQLMIGYSFPKKWMDKTPFLNAELSFVARNIAILHKNVPHIDPESAFSSADGEQGQEFGQLPSARSMGFNLKFSF